MAEKKPDSRRIVSSRHLAEGEGWELSELEFGLIIASNAFSRWMTRCMAAAGQPDLNPLEILILHNVANAAGSHMDADPGRAERSCDCRSAGK